VSQLNQTMLGRSLNGSGATADSVAVFAHAPELLRGLPPEETAELAHVRVPALRVEPGPWDAPEGGDLCHFGFLIVEGVLLRRVTYGGRTGAELLGVGDLLRPWAPQPPIETATARARWQVLDRTELAVLGTGFARLVARWPQIASALLERATARARMLAFQQVASHIPGLEGRLLAMLWAFADRWGRVTPEGVAVPVRLTHATLAELVGASRPSVSSALKVLERQGSLLRRRDGWLLTHRPQARAPGLGWPISCKLSCDGRR